MNIRKYSGLLGIAAAAGLVAAAFAAGQFTGQLPSPIMPFTGSETLPLDTNFAQGAQPQTEKASLAQLGTYFAGQSGTASRNVLIGGDFGTNPWVRGTPSGSIANTLTYAADGWWNLGAAGSNIVVSRQTAAAEIFAGTAATLRFLRTAANADTNPICMGQTVESADSTRFQGQTAVLSFTVKSGALFSAANSILTSTIGYGTSSDDTSANFASTSWAGQVNSNQNNTLTTTFTRFTQSVAIPTTATQIGVKFCYTPVGVAGATDFFEIGQIQLEPTTQAATGAVASVYEPETTTRVLERTQRRAWTLVEPAAGVCQAVGFSSVNTTAFVTVQNPVKMRAAPTVTSIGAALAVTTWEVFDAAVPIALANPFLATHVANTVYQTNLTATTAAAQTVGRGIELCGAGGGGILLISADL